MEISAEPPARAISVVQIACPLCGQADHAQVACIRDATYDVPGEYRVVRCQACAHLYLNPRPDDQSLMDCYPASYAPYEGDDAIPDSIGEPPEAPRKSPLRRLASMLPGLRPALHWLGLEHATYMPACPRPGESKLLEIGCAHGWFLAQAAAQGWVVDGVEPNEAACRRAQARELQVTCGRLEDAQIPDADRDAVAMWMVLEHVPNPVEMVREIHRILKPGGVFTLSVPNAGTWERIVFGRYWLGYDAPRHLQVFNSARLRRLLEEHGFDSIRIVHQSNARYWWGSIAAWGMERFPQHRWPKRWMGYFRREPPRAWHWLLLLPSKAAALLRCSGRITVVAHKAATKPR